ncbi:MAG: ABC transporter ATP-binding protein, partial [Bdellovibrionota bacterium]
GADAFFRAKISRRVHEMIERSGAVIFVSHSETQIEKVCNRAIVLEGGTVAFDGDVETAIAFYKKS